MFSGMYLWRKTHKNALDEHQRHSNLDELRQEHLHQRAGPGVLSEQYSKCQNVVRKCLQCCACCTDISEHYGRLGQ